MSAPPRGWLSEPLGDIADTSLGRMLDRGKSSGHPEVPYLRNVNVQWGRIDVSDVLTMEMPPEQQEFFRLRAGDLLVCEGGEIGRCAVWPGGGSFMAFQKALHRIRPSKAVDARFLRYQLEHMHLVGLLARFATGSTIKHLPQQQLRRLPVLVPPLAEQRRIVEALEDHLSRLDAAVTNLERTRKRLEGLRAALLRECTEMSREGSDVAIGSLASIRNGMYISRPQAQPDGVPILRIGSVRSLSLDVTDVRYTMQSEAEVGDKGYLLMAGDLLFTRYNGNPEYVGACAVVTNELLPLTYPDKLIRARLDISVGVPEFVAMHCSTGSTRRQIRAAVKTTAGQAGISGRDLKAVVLKLPPIEVQRRAATRYAEAARNLNRLEREAKAGIRKAWILHRALLRQAFSGRLVTQDPRDEPASALLDRLNAERAVVPERARRRARTG